MPLLWEHRRHTRAPRLLHRVENPHLVVNQHVMVRWIALLHVVEFLFLVDVDHHLSVDGFAQSRALNLERLKNHVAVGQDRRLAVLFVLLDHVERAGEQPVREMVVHQEVRHRDDSEVARMIDPVALQRAQIVRVAELGAQLLEIIPVALLLLVADVALEIALHVGNDVVVVDQRVIDVKQKNNMFCGHRCEGPPPTMIAILTR